MKPVASGDQPPPFPESQFKLDPATAAEALLTRPLTAKDVTKAVELWAPHDLAAANAWMPGNPEEHRTVDGRPLSESLTAEARLLELARNPERSRPKLEK